MTLQEITAQLALLHDAGKRFQFVERAQRVLAQVDDAPELTGRTIRALTELGLGGPARELLQVRRDVPAGSPERADFDDALKNLPNGRIAWSRYKDTFNQNLEVLKPLRPDLVVQAGSAQNLLSKLHLYKTTQGQHLLSRREPGKLREWLVDLSTFEQEADMEIPPRGELETSAIIGARYGAALEAIYDNTHRTFLSYSHPLYVVESDLVRFAAWLHCGNRAKWLCDARIQWLVGDDCLEQLERLLVERTRLVVPKMIFNFGGSAQENASVSAVLERVLEQRQSEFDQLQEQLEERYRDRDASYWSERFKPPGLVLGFTSRFTTVLQYSMRDTLRALENQGYQTRVLIESADHEALSPGDLCRAILEHDPVLVIYLDHMRYEYPYLPKNVPFLCWIQDPLPKLLCREAGESVGPLDFVCGYFRERCVDELGYPEEQYEFTNIPISTAVFHDGALDREAESQYGCDICYVSNASSTAERLHESALGEYPEWLHPLLRSIRDHVSELLDQQAHVDFQFGVSELVPPLAAKLGLALNAEQTELIHTHFAYRLFDWGRRHQTLEWVAAWARRTGRSFRLYGSGWEDHPTLSEFAAGVLEHGEPLRQAYRASRLSLQLIPEGFRHQRALEVLACGTLPMTRYCPNDFDGLDIEIYVAQRERGEHPEGIATIFPELERIVFRSPEEFETLAERFLADGSHRRQVLADLRNVVMRDYTYDAVMSRMVKLFQEHVARQANPATLECST